MALCHEKYNQRRGRKPSLLLQVLSQTLSKHTGSCHAPELQLRETSLFAFSRENGEGAAVTSTLVLPSTSGIDRFCCEGAWKGTRHCRAF